MAVLALGLAACGAHPGTRRAESAAPGASSTVASVQTVLPACRAGQLRSRYTYGGPAAGTYYVPVSVTNLGRPCALSVRSLVVFWTDVTRVVRSVGQSPILTSRTVGRDRTRLYLLALPYQCLYYGPAAVARTRLHVAVDGTPLRVHGPGVPSFVLSCGRPVLLPQDAPAYPTN
jgi:hypothetical protein